MKKAVMAILVAAMIALSAFAFVGCDDSDNVGGSDEEHKHAFSTAWKSDENFHWHEATCGHSVESDKGAHDFTENSCSVCGYIKSAQTGPTTPTNPTDPGQNEPGQNEPEPEPVVEYRVSSSVWDSELNFQNKNNFKATVTAWKQGEESSNVVFSFNGNEISHTAKIRGISSGSIQYLQFENKSTVWQVTYEAEPSKPNVRWVKRNAYNREEAILDTTDGIYGALLSVLSSPSSLQPRSFVEEILHHLTGAEDSSAVFTYSLGKFDSATFDESQNRYSISGSIKKHTTFYYSYDFIAQFKNGKLFKFMFYCYDSMERYTYSVTLSDFGDVDFTVPNAVEGQYEDGGNTGGNEGENPDPQVRYEISEQEWDNAWSESGFFIESCKVILNEPVWNTELCEWVSTDKTVEIDGTVGCGLCVVKGESSDKDIWYYDDGGEAIKKYHYNGSDWVSEETDLAFYAAAGQIYDFIMRRKGSVVFENLSFNSQTKSYEADIANYDYVAKDVNGEGYDKMQMTGKIGFKFIDGVFTEFTLSAEGTVYGGDPESTEIVGIPVTLNITIKNINSTSLVAPWM